MIRFVVFSILTTCAVGCVTPGELRSTKTQRDEMLLCRTMCDKNTKVYSPITGECECYPKK